MTRSYKGTCKTAVVSLLLLASCALTTGCGRIGFAPKVSLEQVACVDCEVCGDGVIGPGETCDPIESCPLPSSCIPTSTCERVEFEGDALRCTARCTRHYIDMCSDAPDRCCPANCSASDDVDCSASCGDGMVDGEAGETCEAESEQPCSTSCDDGDDCTEDALSGSATNCNAACTHRPIVEFRAGDACCPAGAHSLQDADCAPICGNQVPEAGEACDPCPATCADTDPCSVDTLMGSAAACNATCVHTPIATAAPGDACCPPGADSISDSDCSPSCGNGTVEAGEACDGDAVCRANCTRRFHPALIHRYAFDGPNSGSEASRVIDSIGARHGSVSGDVLDGDGKVTLAGGSSGGFVNLPNGLLSTLTHVTLEAWVSWRGGARNQAVFDFGMNSYGEGSSSGDGTSFLFASPSGLTGTLNVVLNATPRANDIDLSHRFDSSSALPTSGVWHLAVTFADPGPGQRKSLKLYRNGGLVAGGDNNVPAQTDGAANRLSNIDDRNVWLGRANYPEDRFAGTFHEFRIYDQALSAADIGASFSAGRDPTL